MSLSAMCSVTWEGEEFLYFADDTGGVYALDFDTENAVLIDGNYTLRFIGADAQVTKRGIRIVQEGSGRELSGTLTVTMDNGRVFSIAVEGPYDSLNGILFYQELDPTQATGRVFVCAWEGLQGVGVALGDCRLEYVPTDAGG